MKKRKISVGIIVSIFIIFFGILIFIIYKNGYIKSSADTTNLSNISQRELKDSGYLLVNLPPDVSINDDTKVDSLINAASIQKQQQPEVEQSTKEMGGGEPTAPIDNIVILVDKYGNPILPDKEKVSSKGYNASGQNELTFEYENWSDQQLDSIKKATNNVYPKIKELYGPPAFSNTVKITRGSCGGNGGTYSPSTNTICIAYDGYDLIDDNTQISSDSSILIHEMMHSFHDDYIIWSSPWEEGMASSSTNILENIIHNTNQPVGFETIYDSLNYPFESDGDYYSQASPIWAKFYYENNNFFKEFNSKYYLARSNNNQQGVSKIVLFENFPQIEGEDTPTWYVKQHIFNNFSDGKINARFIPGQSVIEVTNVSSNSVDIKVSLYDYKNNFFGDIKQTINSKTKRNFYLSDFQNFDINTKQRLKLVLEYEGQQFENYGVNLPTIEQHGIYGFIAGIDNGTINLIKNNDSASKISKEIINGSFSFGDIAIPQGQYELSYQINGKDYKRVIDKGNGDYYTALAYHTDNEIAEIQNTLNQTQITAYNIGMNTQYLLPQKYITFATVQNNEQKIYNQSTKYYVNDAKININNLIKNTNYNYFANVFFSDNYLVQFTKDFKTTNLEPFKVLYSTPTNGAENFNVASEVKITFNRPLAEFTKDSYIYFEKALFFNNPEDNTEYDISFNADRTELTLKPKKNLEYNMEYQVFISDLKDTSGNPMDSSSYYINFTTQLAPNSQKPEITNSIPADKEKNVDIGSAIKINTNNELDNNYINDSILLYKSGGDELVGGDPIVGQTNYDSISKTLTFNPNNKLDKNTAYVVYTSGLKDIYGNNFIPYYYSWTFTTIAENVTPSPTPTSTSTTTSSPTPTSTNSVSASPTSVNSTNPSISSTPSIEPTANNLTNKLVDTGSNNKLSVWIWVIIGIVIVAIVAVLLYRKNKF